VADITTQDNRGKVMGILEILSWVALLFVYGGAGIVIENFGYFAFFYIVGGLVFVLGLIAGLLLEENKEDAPDIKVSYFQQLRESFSKSQSNLPRDLWKVLIAITLWGVAQQIFFPYLITYINHALNKTATESSIVIFFAILIGGIGAAYPLGILVDKWGRKKIALIAVAAEAVGLFAFSLAQSNLALVLTGILWLAPISAWTIATSAWTKDLFPEDKRGQFGGYVILFSVAFTMIPGPLLGSWLITTFGMHTVLNGQEAFVPTSLIFQVSAFATLFAAIPLFLIHTKKKEIEKVS
jgi:MFS family permease